MVVAWMMVVLRSAFSLAGGAYARLSAVGLFAGI
jgi:hypothetical protein